MHLPPFVLEKTCSQNHPRRGVLPLRVMRHFWIRMGLSVIGWILTARLNTLPKGMTCYRRYSSHEVQFDAARGTTTTGGRQHGEKREPLCLWVVSLLVYVFCESNHSVSALISGALLSSPHAPWDCDRNTTVRAPRLPLGKHKSNRWIIYR